MANVAAFYTTPEDKLVQSKWVARFSEVLRGDQAGAYVNFVNDEGDAALRSAYPGATLDRLRRVKATYDPQNLFRLNQNITPAA
jgi:hypothetical protein